jgi:hypothetical protein
VEGRFCVYLCIIARSLLKETRFDLGSKQQGGLYDPSQLMAQSEGNVVFVAANYRVSLRVFPN